MRVFGRRLALVGAGLALGASVAAAQTAAPPAGRSLEEVLRALQGRGLRLIFSSQVVTREMRVSSEPRASDPRRQLDEVLAPLGLMVTPGPAGVLLVVRDRRAPRPAAVGSSPPVATQARDAGDTAEPSYTERVIVTASQDDRRAYDGGATILLAGRDLQTFSRGLVDDPLRALQAVPIAGTGDDFRSDVPIRASPPRHVGVVVDGIATPWLKHAAPGGGDAGTLTMFGSEVVDEATLQPGAYPRRYGNQLGAQIELGLREGSRAAPHFQAAVSRTLAGGTAEGPLGTTARGSWLLAMRRSYVEWPISRTDHGATVFGFADAVARFVYDVRPAQQLTVGIIAGQSSLERDDTDPMAPASGANQAALVNVGWRSSVGSGLVIQQRVAGVVRDFTNANAVRAPIGGGEDSAFLYRVEGMRALFGGVIETGAQAERRQMARRGRADGAEGFGAPAIVDWGDRVSSHAWTTAAHAHYRWSAGRLTIAPGVRVATSSAAERPAVDRWVQTEWRWGSSWSLHGSAALVHQLPGLDQAARAERAWRAALLPLAPERALHLDVGIRQRAPAGIEWGVTAYARAERDLLRWRPDARGFDNALTGLARGVEVSVERRAGGGLTGWVGYALGASRQTDPAHHQTYWADFDQRHSLNAVASYQLPRGWAIGATMKAGSPLLNTVRLPAYARLDLRGERTLVRGGRSLTVYAELVNALDHRNVGVATATVTSREGLGFTQPLYPRMISGGVRLEF